MFPLLLGLAGIFWLAALGGREALRQPVASKEELLPPPKATDTAPGGAAPSGGAKEGLFGVDAPFDPTVIFGAGAGSGSLVDWSLPGLLSATRSSPASGLPAGAYVAQSVDPAAAPIESGERVTFVVEQPAGVGKDELAVLEGIYSGPSNNLSYEGATVTVDRTALSGSTEMAAGKYSIPASKRNYEQTYVARVVWTSAAPDSAGLTAISAPPLAEGDKLTLVCRDAYGNTVIWIGQVEGGSFASGSYDVVLQKAYRVLRDVGEGKISRPFFMSQATVKLPTNWLVDPKSIPA